MNTIVDLTFSFSVIVSDGSFLADISLFFDPNDVYEQAVEDGRGSGSLFAYLVEIDDHSTCSCSALFITVTVAEVGQ